MQSGAFSSSRFFVMRLLVHIIICVFLTLSLDGYARNVTPKDDFRDSVMNRIYRYYQLSYSASEQSHESYAYTKFMMRTNHRNFTLAMVPSLYAIAHGSGREFMGEYYSKYTVKEKNKITPHRLLCITTVPHKRNTMPSLLNYLTPNVYGECLFQDNILSPYHRSNRKYYKFMVTALPFGKAQVYAYPKLKNTQLVTSMAIVDSHTGRINLVDFEGEYDMTRFFISVVMNKEDSVGSLYPKKCDLRANFRFMGNQITARYSTIYGLPKLLSDSLNNVEDTTLMAKVRPTPLNEEEMNFLNHYYQKKNERDSLAKNEKHKKSFVKDVLWDIVGDNVLNRIKQNFGKQNQGYLRINPILNPLYMGYSERKGFVYKFDVRGSYSFSDDVQFALRFKAGYAFKQHRFYFSIPATLNYNKKHDGFLQLELGNGNRINTNVVARRILDISEKKDSLIQFPYGDYTAFKDNYWRLTNHWIFNNYIGFELGIIAHQRQSISPEFYKENNFPSLYRAVAPALALVWHPIGKNGPVVKVDYERSFNHFLHSNISYERVEMDMQDIINMSRRRSLSLRLGSGFYTQKGDHWYFVDYTNFRDNNLPGGWNDDWAGEFELLNSGWYNASDYYVRSNVTYESPALFAAWLPWVGRFIENERYYVNALMVRHLHPYTEWGYGFKTRVASVGIFASFQNTKFQGVGCKFGFELFREW